jgi:hypothetical protein
MRRRQSESLFVSITTLCPFNLHHFSTSSRTIHWNFLVELTHYCTIRWQGYKVCLCLSRPPVCASELWMCTSGSAQFHFIVTYVLHKLAICIDWASLNGNKSAQHRVFLCVEYLRASHSNFICKRSYKSFDLTFTHALPYQLQTVLSQRSRPPGVYESCECLGAFAKLRKTTISFVMSVHLSVRPSVCKHGTTRFLTGRFFIKFGIWDIFENLSKKFKFY